MEARKLSEMAKKDPSLYHRIGELVTKIALEICDAKKKRDHEAQELYESLGKQAVEAIEKDDFALFGKTEIEFQVSQLV